MTTKRITPTQPITLLKPATRARALQVEKRLQELYDLTKRNFIETGRLIVEAEDSALWALLTNAEGDPYSSFDNWISTALHYGRTTALAARDIVREFQGIPDATLQEISRINLKRLMLLPPKERKSSKWLRAAATLPAKELEAEIHTTYPEMMPEASTTIRMTFGFTRRQAEKVHRALSLVCEEETSSITKEECFVMICEIVLRQDRGSPAKKRARAA